MAIFTLMEWDGVTKEQYDAVRRISNFEGQAPKGGKFHVASFSPKGLRVTDVWQVRRRIFQDFVEKQPDACREGGEDRGASLASTLARVQRVHAWLQGSLVS